MTELPESLEKHSTKWRLALGLLVFADLAAVVSTFLPMKAVLVLASQDVPSFFPEPLVNAGPLVTSLILLVLALTAAGIVWLMNHFLSLIDGDRAIGDAAKHAPTPPSNDEVNRAQKQRAATASLVLILPITAILIFFSGTYLALSVLWMAISFLVVLVKTRRSVMELNKKRATWQATNLFAQWLRFSALWSIVVIALLTLMVSTPALGATAILVAAIFGRRLFLAVADLSLFDGTSGRVREAPKPKKFTETRMSGDTKVAQLQPPISIFSDREKFVDLRQVIAEEGFDPDTVQFLSIGMDQTLSALASRDDAEQVLIRVFESQRADLRDSELDLRKAGEHAGIFAQAPSSPREIAKFPSIVVRLQSPDLEVDLDHTLDQSEAIDWQIRRELETTKKDISLQGSTNSSLDMEELTNLLETTSQVPNHHSASLDHFSSQLDLVFGEVRKLPLCLVPARPLSPSNLYRNQEGSLNFLGGTIWSAGRMGDSWGLPSRYRKYLSAMISEGDYLDPQTALRASLNSYVHKFRQALRNFDTQNAGTYAKNIFEILESLNLRH